MLTPTVEAIRLFLHVLAATVWVGGQIVMLGLVPAARGVSPDAPRRLARAFARLSWPAFAVLVATGIWNVVAVHPASQSSAWRAVLTAKIVVVVVTGVAAYLHQRAAGRRQLALWGSVAGVASLVALYMGIALAG